MGRMSRDELLQLVFPGLLATLDAFCGVDLEPTLCHPPTVKYDSAGSPLAVSLGVRREVGVQGRTAVVQIAVRVRKTPAGWNTTYHSYHFGPNPNAMDVVYFRIDNEAVGGPHCHIRGHGPDGEKGGHIRFSRIEPLPTSDPFAFIELVKKYIATGVLPLQVVRP